MRFVCAHCNDDSQPVSSLRDDMAVRCPLCDLRAQNTGLLAALDRIADCCQRQVERLDDWGKEIAMGSILDILSIAHAAIAAAEKGEE
mgnify:CR=1 FL=1